MDQLSPLLPLLRPLDHREVAEDLHILFLGSPQEIHTHLCLHQFHWSSKNRMTKTHAITLKITSRKRSPKMQRLCVRSRDVVETQNRSRWKLGPVQTLLHSCAEPNWWIKYGKRAASESIWYGSFSLVRTESVELLSNLTYARHTVRRLNQMSRQCRSKVELIQLGSARPGSDAELFMSRT